jgi:hypothetical protein
VEKIQNPGTGHSRKEIFVAAGESDHFVGKHRADNDDPVVFEHLAVDLDRHVHGKETVRQCADLVRRNDANLAQLPGVIPGMIEKTHGPIGPGPFRRRQVQTPANGFLAHGLVGPQGNHHVQFPRETGKAGVQSLEDRADRGGPGSVRNDDQDSLPMILILGAGFRHQGGDFGSTDASPRRCCPGMKGCVVHCWRGFGQIVCAKNPPSTRRSVPVTKLLARALARNTAAPTNSRALPIRFMGV